MARGQGSIYKTKKCKCNNPNWQLTAKSKVKTGKHFGKIKYLIFCSNCKSQWETSAKYAKELFKEV